MFSQKNYDNFFRKASYACTALLRNFPPEFAHNVALKVLKKGILDYFPKPKIKNHHILNTHSMNFINSKRIKHPIGLAAGFDKNCECPLGLIKLGFSFLEFGGVTPLPQQGHKKPRIKRLRSQRAIINHMGLNNLGVDEICNRLQLSQNLRDNTPFGLNIGVNMGTLSENILYDYIYVLQKVGGLVDYYTINCSCPNSENIASGPSSDFINDLAYFIEKDTDVKIKDIWIKLSPDMSKHSFQSIVEQICNKNFGGIVVSNTKKTINPMEGGLSGHPLLLPSTTCLEWAWEVHKGNLPMIGVGGILSGEDVFQKIIRGAHAVQIYTSLIYRGPWVVFELLEELEQILSREKYTNLQDLVGVYY